VSSYIGIIFARIRTLPARRKRKIPSIHRRLNQKVQTRNLFEKKMNSSPHNRRAMVSTRMVAEINQEAFDKAYAKKRDTRKISLIENLLTMSFFRNAMCALVGRWVFRPMSRLIFMICRLHLVCARFFFEFFLVKRGSIRLPELQILTCDFVTPLTHEMPFRYHVLPNGRLLDWLDSTHGTEGFFFVLVFFSTAGIDFDLVAGKLLKLHIQPVQDTLYEEAKVSFSHVDKLC
jgi:hypothetical protein